MSASTKLPRSGPIVFLDNREIRRRCNLGKTNLQNKVNDGLFPKPVSLGKRKRATPEHECEEVLAAYLSGASDSEVKNLVARLHAARGGTPGNKTDQNLDALQQGRAAYWQRVRAQKEMGAQGRRACTATSRPTRGSR